MSARRETRIFSLDRCELRGVDDSAQGRVFTGHASVFNALSEELWGFYERVADTAFDDAIAGANDVRFLFNHNPDLILGRSTSETLRLSKDAEGLLSEAEFPDTSYARDLATSMDRGDVDGMSFGFRVVEDSWTEEELTLADGTTITVTVRTLLRVELFDVSVVVFPAYPQTAGAQLNSKAAYRATFDREEGEPEKQSVVAFQNLPLADPDTVWDPDGARTRVLEWAGGDLTEPVCRAKFSTGFLWHDPTERDTATAFQFPIGDIVDGELRAIPDAIRGAVGPGTRPRAGSLDTFKVPSTTGRAPRDHLARYFEAMDEPPPWAERSEREASPATLNMTVRVSGLEEAEREIAEFAERVGKVLSGKNKDLLSSAIAALQEVMDAADETDGAAGGETREVHELPDLRPLLAALEERGWDDIDDFGIYCLTQMISLGSSYILWSDDPDLIEQMRTLLLGLSGLLDPAIAAPAERAWFAIERRRLDLLNIS